MISVLCVWGRRRGGVEGAVKLGRGEWHGSLGLPLVARNGPAQWEIRKYILAIITPIQNRVFNKCGV